MRDTQVEAWQVIKETLPERQAAVLSILAKRAAAGFEVAHALGWEVYRTLPRITELAKAGVIMDTGMRTINPSSGCKVIVWSLAD